MKRQGFNRFSFHTYASAPQKARSVKLSQLRESNLQVNEMNGEIAGLGHFM